MTASLYHGSHLPQSYTFIKTTSMGWISATFNHVKSKHPLCISCLIFYKHETVLPKDDSPHANAGTFRERNLFSVFLRKASGYILLQNPGGVWSCGICFLTVTSKNSCTKSNQESFSLCILFLLPLIKDPLVSAMVVNSVLLHQIKRLNWHFGAI